MRNPVFFVCSGLLALFISCSSPSPEDKAVNDAYADRQFIQDYSIKYYSQGEVDLKKVVQDRNGSIQLLSESGLYKPHAGQFLYPGRLLADKSYLPMADKKLSALGLFQDQFVYLDDKALFSNAWAGSFYREHQLDQPSIMAGGGGFDFMISDGGAMEYLTDEGSIWKGNLGKKVILDIKYHASTGTFIILATGSLHVFSPQDKEIKEVYTGSNLTCFEITEKGEIILIGTEEGYLELDGNSFKPLGEINRDLPWPNLKVIKEIKGRIWFGSERGAFVQQEAGRFNYYHGERWLPGDEVKDIAEGLDNTVLLLTDGGMAKIIMEEMTLYDKALFFDKQVRQRHIRYGFNANLVDMEPGNFDTGRLGDSDNDGLWTGMYLGGLAFRYTVEPSDEVLQHIRESLAAMERLYTINPIPGFPSRSFARSGYIEKLADPERWQQSPDPEWDWKATTSSDEAIGHIFAFGVVAELVEDQELRDKSIALIDTLMGHIVKNDWYLVDYDGQPTTWGRWNPEYVNGFPPEVGDRKLNSSNIIAMLQTAYHFTNKDIYKEKAFELMQEHGYLENLMVPMKQIGMAPDGSDDWGKMLSEAWNHSDDEMYFLGYWGLYRYAFNDTLKNKYKESIIDHWEAERPEKEGAWNIFTAMVDPKNFDREEAIWYLQEYPLDLITWTMTNSHRRDIEAVETNFRRQSIREVLPPDELRISRHNANRFVLDGGDGGVSEYSAGDIWLLPYWMGRYLGVIGKPDL